MTLPRHGSLGELFARQGIDWATLALVDCGRWLEAGQRDGYQRFCPNAGFVERAKGRAAR